MICATHASISEKPRRAAREDRYRRWAASVGLSLLASFSNRGVPTSRSSLWIALRSAWREMQSRSAERA